MMLMTSPEDLMDEGSVSPNPRTRQQATACRAMLDQLDAMLDDDARVAEALQETRQRHG